MRFTVGFDLDMTLIDPRPGMVELFDILRDETGIPLDGKGFVSRLGPPLSHEFARYGVSDADSLRLTERFRELYPDVVIPKTTALPGAIAALEAVTQRGGQSVVVSGKHAPNVKAHLDALNITVTAIAGGLWSTGKADALRAHHAEMYVGDHVGDVAGARAADALAIGVATGPMTIADLKVAGADIVFSDLTEFPTWLGSYLTATVH